MRYKNFQNDVLTLQQLLEKLRESLQNAQRRYIDRGRSLTVRTYEPLSEDFERERKTLFGDVGGTLRACDALLKENIKLRFRYSNDAEQLAWQLARQEQHVALLRRRLQVHSQKVRFAIERLSQDLLTDRYNHEDSLLTIAERNTRTSYEILPDLHRQLSGHGSLRQSIPSNVNPVSSAISRKFEEGILIDPPPYREAGLPLTLTFDALVDAFLESNSGLDQTPERYLFFLKTRWILDRLKESIEYQEASPAVYYRFAVTRIENETVTRLREPGKLVAYDDSVLISLGPPLFRIWPSKMIVPSVQYTASHPLTARANEEKLAAIKLGSGDPVNPDTVTVFKSSDRGYRIVVNSTLDPAAGSTSLTQQTVYSWEDKLIPRYALPTLMNPSAEMAIFSRGEEFLYKFNTLSDLYKFQTALTGYDVSHDQSNVRCQFSDDCYFLDCVARLQLWQEPILAPLPGEDGNLQRNRSVRTQASFSESVYSQQPSLLSSVAASNTVSWTTNGWEADRIKLPVIKMFTQLADKSQKQRFAIISIPLAAEVYIDPSECGCTRDYLSCSKLVLTKGKKKSFPVKTLYAEIDTTGQPNPNTFDLFPFRLLGHPRDLAIKHTEYLVLKFKSLTEKQSFHRELDLRFRVRDKQIEDQRNFTSTIRNRQDRPQGRPKVVPPGRSQMDTPSVLSFHTTLAPVIDEPDTGPTFVQSLANRGGQNRSSQKVDAIKAGPVVPSPRSPSSSRTAQSMCTSLDSMVLACGDVDRIDRYLDSRAVVTPDTASSIHSAAVYSDAVQSQSGLSSSPIQDWSNAEKHEEFYAPPLSRLNRSPSSVAPEYYNPNAIHEKYYEATGYYRPMTAQHNQKFITPKTFEILPEHPTPPSTSQSGLAPQWYDPESMNTYYNYGRPDQDRDVRTQLAQVRHESPGFQNELSVSRNKTTKRKGNFSSLKFWQKERP